MKRTQRKPTTLPLGSVSTGTLRPEDVIPELLSLADTVRMSRDDRRRVHVLSDEFYQTPTDDDHGEIWEELQDLLDSYAPPFCYVGSLEGDGACIGVWISFEAVEQARQDGEVWQDPDDGSSMPAEAVHRLVVSDHGNMSLYTRSGRELWGVV